MNTTNLTPTEAVSTEAETETAITSAASAVSAASATLTTTPAPAASASATGPAVVPARFPAPVRATSGEPWPGKCEWNDHDYRQFVELISQGAFSEVENDSCVWDEFFVRDRESDTPFRPTLISRDDYRDHLTYYREYYGLLAWKLWDVARSKGFTAAYDEEMRREEEELERQEKEANRVDVRKEVDAVKYSLPNAPKAPADPHEQWYNATTAEAGFDGSPEEKARLLERKVINGQPFRNAVAAGADRPGTRIYGPLMMHGTPEDNLRAANTEPEVPESPGETWHPHATSRQIVNGIARDLSDLVSTLVARQKVAVGFTSDTESIREVCRLTRSLCELNRVVQETHRRKTGPKPKRRLPKTN